MAKGRHVRMGQALHGAISADDFSALLAMLEQWRRRQAPGNKQPLRSSVAPETYKRRNNIALIKNETGADRQRGEIVGLGDFIVEPRDNLNAWYDGATFEGLEPTEADHKARFGVLLEPIAKSEYGLATVAGVAPVRLQASTPPAARGGFSEVSDDHGCSGLLEADTGSARILGKQADASGQIWAFVRLGGYSATATLSLPTDPEHDEAPWTVASPADGSSTDVTITVPVREVDFVEATDGDPTTYDVVLGQQQAAFDVMIPDWTCVTLDGGHKGIRPKIRSVTLIDWDIVNDLELSDSYFDLSSCLQTDTDTYNILDSATCTSAIWGDCVAGNIEGPTRRLDFPSWFNAALAGDVTAQVCGWGVSSSGA